MAAAAARATTAESRDTSPASVPIACRAAMIAWTPGSATTAMRPDICHVTVLMPTGAQEEEEAALTGVALSASGTTNLSS